MERKTQLSFIPERNPRLTLLAILFKACSFKQAICFQIYHFASLSGGQVPDQQTIITNVAGNAEDGMSRFGTRII